MSKLESLDDGLFQALSADETRELLGGAHFTFRGGTGLSDGTVDRDYDEDARAV